VSEPSRPLIFVVDDDPLVVRSLTSLLELETEDRVRAFTSGPAALAAFDDEPPDVLISDLTMPGMDGLALLEEARRRSPDTARIVLTGYADKESAVRAINQAGVYQFIEKPWDNDYLLITVANAARAVALTRELHATIAELTARNRQLEETLAELRETQDRLIASERLAAVGRLASGIAHEIGNQLSLLGYAELLADRYAADPEVRTLTDPLLAARRRLASMVASIKEFVRGGSGGGAGYPRTAQPIAPILDEALNIFRFEPALKLRTLTRAPWDAEARAVVNAEKLLQVMLNLVRNAIQATREGGTIRVGLAREGGHVVIEVEDNGYGIAPEHLARIWEPFFSTKGDMGTGLGLGICKRIIDEHGGTITVASRPREGARFTVELPAAPAASTSPSPSASPSDSPAPSP
jgi:signal transduction histidine kinase